MQSATEKKLIFYTALFIAIILNVFKLLALRQNGYMHQFWQFNAGELLFQFLWNFLFCIATGFGINYIASLPYKKAHKALMATSSGVLLLLVMFGIGVRVQQKIFHNTMPDGVFRFGYLMRLLASCALMLIIVRIIFLIREREAKKLENDQLKQAYSEAQLSLLKEELNPHFFFNALSTLSGLVREDAHKAQQYISVLSKIFRYSLNKQYTHTTSVEEEVQALTDYAALMHMRVENALITDIKITTGFMKKRIVYMSLQPLIENAVKHNSMSPEKPLTIHVYNEDDYLVVQNNLQNLPFQPQGTGTGLSNLHKRCLIVTGKNMLIEKNETSFTVKLPVI